MTLEELCKEYGITSDESQEKTASANNESDSKLVDELIGETETNLNGGENMNLQDLYEEVASETVVEEQEKVAMDKVASEYEAAGRFMAMGFFDELEKIASGKAVEQESDSEELPQQLYAEGAAGTKLDDDSQLAVNTEEARSANKDALREKLVYKLLKKKHGVNVSGQVGEDHKVGPDSNK